MGLSKEIESRINRFVVELSELVRKQAIQAVSESFGGGGAPRARAVSVDLGAPAGGAKAGRRSRRKGEKRTPAELVQLEQNLFDFVRGNGGRGIEAIGKALSIETKDLARPMKKLIARGVVRTEGARRATKYHPVDGASANASADAPRRGRKPGAAAKKRAKKR